MGKFNILSLSTEPPPEVKEPEVVLKGPDPSRWGTEEERYRRLCMLILLCRYGYYCKKTSLISDEQYDRLEKLVARIEDENRTIIHRRTPTVTPGSDRAGDYPRSVQDIFASDESIGTLAILGQTIEWFIKDGCEFFHIDPERLKK